MKVEGTAHNVFWTGGLDSTAHLMHLLLKNGEQVQPHYIVRSEESTGNEINTMNRIRRLVHQLYPAQASRLLPTIYRNEDLIPRSGEIDLEIRKLKEKVKVHEQLHILADYCWDAGIEDIDITYERNRHQEPGELFVAQFFHRTRAFKSFHNVLEDMTKRESYNRAVGEGVEEVLKLTSFCRRPRSKGRPCGTCGPCCDAVKEGMGFRMPLSSRIKARILIPFRQFYRKNYTLHDRHWFFKIIKRRFEHKL